MREDSIEDLLDRWYRGDGEAQGALVERNWRWVKARVRMRLGERLRRVGDSDDFVQETLLDFLEYAPKFRVAGESQLRGLLSRVLENAIRAQDDRWFQARRRELSRERPVCPQTVLNLVPAGRGSTPPDERAEKRETSALLRLAVELLGPDDRRVIVLRHWDGKDFGPIGAELGITPDGARKRYERALPRLAAMLKRLRVGDLEDLSEPTELES